MPTEDASVVRGSHVHFAYPNISPPRPTAEDLLELAGCRKLAMAVVECAWKDLRGRNPALAKSARHYLTKTFWEADHHWRMLIADLVVEEKWRKELGLGGDVRGEERDG